jgi:hypothetical protein
MKTLMMQSLDSINTDIRAITAACGAHMIGIKTLPV